MKKTRKKVFLIFIISTGFLVSVILLLLIPFQTQYLLKIKDSQNGKKYFVQSGKVVIEYRISIKESIIKRIVNKNKKFLISAKIDDKLIGETEGKKSELYSIDLDLSDFTEGDYIAVLTLLDEKTLQLYTTAQTEITIDNTPPTLSEITFGDKPKKKIENNAEISICFKSKDIKLQSFFSEKSQYRSSCIVNENDDICPAENDNFEATSTLEYSFQDDQHIQNFSLTYTLLDKAGNENTGKINFLYDPTEPVMTVLSKTSIYTNEVSGYILRLSANKNLTIDVVGIDNEVVSANTSSEDYTFDVSGLDLKEGENKFTINGSDCAENVTNIEVTILVEEAPVATPTNMTCQQRAEIMCPNICPSNVASCIQQMIGFNCASYKLINC